MTPAEHRFAGPAGGICWFEWGTPQTGKPTLLLLHATGFHARCWDRVVAELPGAHIVALDLRGHGRSYKPDSLSDWTATTSDALSFVQAELSGPLFAVGHSMGGHVAARVAAVSPASFVGLLLVDPVIMSPDTYTAMAGLPLGDPEEHPVSRRRNAWESGEQMIAHFADRPPYAHWQPDVLADYCNFGLLPLPGGGFELACPPRLEASAYMGAGRSDPYPLLGDITCPVTVLRARNGERSSALDFSLSPTWPDLAKAIPRGLDIHWSEASHFIPMEMPDRLAALIRDLASEQG